MNFDIHFETKLLNYIYNRLINKKAFYPILYKHNEAQSSISKYTIIVTGNSIKHINFLITLTIKILKKFKYEIISRSKDGNWSIVDTGNIIIHFFDHNTRNFYNIESIIKQNEENNMNNNEVCEKISNIEYSNKWKEYSNMQIKELDEIKLSSLNNEDLDLLYCRYNELQTVNIDLNIYILNSKKENSIINYSNIYEEVILYYITNKLFNKAKEVIEEYENFNKNSHNKDFIDTNKLLCNIIKLDTKDAISKINEVLKKDEEQSNYWKYHELALDLFFNDNKKLAIYILEACISKSKNKDSIWNNILSKCLNNIKEY